MKQFKWILLMVATVLVMTGCSAKAVYKDGTYNGSGDGKECVTVGIFNFARCNLITSGYIHCHWNRHLQH